MSAREIYSKGARIWIPDQDQVWRAAKLLEDYTGQKEINIQYEDGEDAVIQIDKKNLPHLRNPDILIGENDLTSLSYLNEPEVLYNLKVRFVEQNIIYTYCGIVLVAVNPYEQLPIYSNDIIQAYSGQDMGAMDPHIFAVAEEAFKKMSRFDQNQSIIVSGESGAGKTVSAKYAMRYFAAVGGSQADTETQVEKKVLASNPIMEAIGNAKTTRNDNSSRFGKYIEISFNKKHEIIGANMRTYLLEKSRVVFQASNERNYHIFYQLCCSKDLPEFKDFKLSSTEDFFYISQGAAPIIDGVDDGADLETTREALSLLGIQAKDQMMIFRIFAAILHFGNIKIRETDGEACEVPPQEPHLTIMCSLLGIEESQMRMWLCNRKIQTVNESLMKPLTESQAWSDSFLRRLGFVKRKGTKAARKLPADFDRQKEKFIAMVGKTVQTNNISAELVINFDQTGVKLVPVSNWTLAEKGAKQVTVVGIDDKHEITMLLGSSASGNLLPPQIIYKGVTDQCHPIYKFPDDWHVTHSANHWSNEQPMLDYVDNVLVPYAKRVKKELRLPARQKSLAIFDVFAAHSCQSFLDLLQKRFFEVRFVPAGCTGELQPMDLSVNAEFKLAIKEKFTKWYADIVAKNIKENTNKPVDLRISLIKPFHARWIVACIVKLSKDKQTVTRGWRSSGLLAVVFETFEVNSFEQFCINYANEKLQQIFNMHVFKLEQEEYVKEQIEWSFIDFYDNQPCIDLIENRLGILDLLDEECKMPKGSDGNWCQKLYDKHLKTSKHFDKPRMSNKAFIINHFADRVTYMADGFLEKNRDTVLEEQINILKASQFEFVGDLFAELKPKMARAGSVSVQPVKAQPKQGSKQHKKTVGSQFRDSLMKLMQTLNATAPHYIRCIKPNDDKEAFNFDPKRAVEQLRACGVLETIRISAAGYPSRWTYSEFFRRYRVLAKSKDINKSNMLKTCENILPKLIVDPDKYRFGKTKIFFRAGQVAYLEKLRSEKLRACGVMIQKHIRGWLCRRKYRKIRTSVLLVQRFGRGLLARRQALFLRQSKAATRIQSQWRGYKERQSYRKLRFSITLLQAHIRGMFARSKYVGLMRQRSAVMIQKQVRAYLARKTFKRVLRGIILLQSHVRRRKARRELKILKVEAKSVEHIKNVNKGLENKIIELQQKLDVKAKTVVFMKEQEHNVSELKTEIQRLKTTGTEKKVSSNRIQELEEEIRRLKEELQREAEEKKDILTEKVQLEKENEELVLVFQEEKRRLQTELDESLRRVKENKKKMPKVINNVHSVIVTLGNTILLFDYPAILKEKLEAANKVILKEFDLERSHHQKLVKEHARLQQRLENLQGEMQVLTSPNGHKRAPSDISEISIESYSSSVTDAERALEEKREEEEDQGYETAKRRAAQSANLLERAMEEVTTPKDENLDVGLLLKLQSKVKELEKDKQKLRRQIERLEDASPSGSPTAMITDSAFNALKEQMSNADDVALVIKLQKRVKHLEIEKNKLSDQLEERDEQEEIPYQMGTDFAYGSLKMQEMQNENDKLKREVQALTRSIAESTTFENSGKMSPAGKKFLDELEAMRDELDRRREECLHLRATLADRSINAHSIAKESYGGHDEIVNEDDELVMAFKTQKDLNRLLQSQLDQTEKETRRKEEEYIQEITELKRENQRQQKLIGQNLTLSPQAKIEATMQHEITRMTAENLDLRETIDKQMDQIRKLKKMLRVYSKKLKDGEAAEIQAEIEQEEQRNENDQLATVKHRERNYMGMLEYRKEDEGALIKNLVIDLKPRLAYELIPGLPAYILFMCVRHTDYTNDDEKVRSLLTATINSIKKVVKKHNNDIERVTLWLANTCRLLHTLKQYSGEKAFQAENTPKQNEQTLRNFDLSEYRQVFSDLAVWIYQSLIKSMEECTQPNIVPAVLEHEAIAGLTASKPSGLRGRTSSSVHEQDAKEYSLDTLMKALNNYMRILTLNAVDPELVKQIFRQVYYFICAGSLNNLLLRKDMCNWSKGMQIRYNLSHLEQWLRDNKLHESGAVATLEPIVQASQLLQARKTDADVDGICEMCSKLSVAQIVKILNLYTPVDEFEERVPISFIRKIQEKLRSRGDENNTLLMETSFTYPVTFPFNPSSIALESITVPEHLHLGFLKKI
ncbi:unconventional myosin-Vb-like [Gigantopelta aegis]|uniref:unconventional myosin-Vb-like n=1 Tax=Gigantopelta aegis TaxID=1735272 RepID=UPI001B88D9E9|nr:unconventional myosin-Vb-like [Gigantopelta aegis]